jgi:hypothetical protein
MAPKTVKKADIAKYVKAEKKTKPAKKAPLKAAPVSKLLQSKKVSPKGTASKRMAAILTVQERELNDETAQALRDAREGKNLTRFTSLEALFADLGI